MFGVVSATYTDHGVGHDNVQTLTTTSQTQIRQKHQEVEFVVSQSGTNTATNTDGGPAPPGNPGTHRGSLAPGDWIQLNGPFNLLNINSRHVPGRGHRRRPHRRLAAGGDRGPSGHPHRADRADVQPRLDGRHGRLDEPDVPDLARRARTSCSSCSVP